MPITEVFVNMSSGGNGIGGRLALVVWCKFPFAGIVSSTGSNLTVCDNIYSVRNRFNICFVGSLYYPIIKAIDCPNKAGNK